MEDDVVRSRIVVVQYVDAIDPSPSDGLELFNWFKSGNFLLVVKHTLSMIVGPAATKLLEHLVDMNDFTAAESRPQPAGLTFPAHWAYNQPAFVRLFNPSLVVLRRIDCRGAYRCCVEAVPPRREQNAWDGMLAALESSEQIYRMLQQIPGAAKRVNQWDTDPAVYINFASPDSSIELQA